LVSRRAVCDICHDTFFIYTFDSTEKVVAIFPVQLTKIDNLHWTEEDIKKLKSRTIGQSILKPFTFDAKVDSISGATVTVQIFSRPPLPLDQTGFLALTDNVQDIVYSKNGHDIVNSKL